MSVRLADEIGRLHARYEGYFVPIFVYVIIFFVVNPDV